MRRGVAAVGAAAFVWCGLTTAAFAVAVDCLDHPATVEEQLLGSADEGERAQAILPFTRQLSVDSFVTGSLADSLAAAGVPPSASLEAVRAIGTAIDLQKDVRTGDRLHARYEQTFALAGYPIGVGRVLWLELRTKAKGTIAIHRFRPRNGVEQFWLASGQAAGVPMVRQPLNVMTVTSGFGLRADPLDHPPSNVTPSVVEVVETPPPVEDKGPSPQEVRAANRAMVGLDRGSLGSAGDVGGSGAEVDRIMAARRIRAREAEERRRQEEAAAAAKAAEPPKKVEAPPAEPVIRKMFMHEGLDLLANTGTPVYAAADGTVTSVGPNGGYGNWIKLGHSGRLTTIYGHLSGFAAGLKAGHPVARGELIGFVGSTGRSTGAHLHFEIQDGGRPVDPAGYPATRSAQLAGADLALFKKQVAASLAERDREAKAGP
jgi:murein DD-endopeptidase MepM/ murein hydrolase activator NlpD